MKDSQRKLVHAVLALVLALGTSSCRGFWGSLEIQRDTQTSGTYYASGWNFTFLSLDLPQDAMLIARENVSDARLDNLDVTTAWRGPYLGPFDWLLEIIGFRRAVIRGTWGFPE